VILLITNKSLFVASSWFLLYLLIKDARSFEHKVNLCCFNHVALAFGIFAISCVVVVFCSCFFFIFVVDTVIIVNMKVIISPKLGFGRHEYIQREQT